MTQQELADTIGTHKGHISRLETARISPARKTVDRIAGALQVTPEERRELFELAGYSAPVLLPHGEDFARVMEALPHVWVPGPLPPTMIIDAFWRVWHVNDSFARLFSTVPTAELAGRHLLEVLVDVRTGIGDALDALMGDEQRDALLAASCARFKMLYDGARLDGSEREWYDGLLQRLYTLDGFSGLWTSAPNPPVHRRIVPLRALPLVTGSHLLLVGVPIAVDTRFSLIFVVPTDADSARTMEQRIGRLAGPADPLTPMGS
jgi:Helix-turn-helix domain